MIFEPHFPLKDALSKTIQDGYAFVSNAITPIACQAMKSEAFGLELAEGDHITYPINAGTKREVRQLHVRAYHSIGDELVPVATQVSEMLAQAFNWHESLKNWMPTEAGYQLYRDQRDWISPHRDRRNDQLLSVTITIEGSAVINIYDYLDDPDDYSKLVLKDSFVTSTGTVMLLRAPGLGNGQQIIHEVMGPEYGSRLILNLRTRPNVLKHPKEWVKQ